MRNYQYELLETSDRTGSRKLVDAPYAAEAGRPGVCMRIIHWFITFGCLVATVIFFPFLAWFSLKMIREYERLVIFRLGILQRPRSAGITLVLPCIDVFHRVDLRMRAFSVPPRQVRLRNGAIVELGCEVHFRIDDAVRCILNVSDLNGSLRILAQTALINRVSKLTLEELQYTKSECAQQLMADLNETTSTWGVAVNRCEISQLKVIASAGGPQTAALPGTMTAPPLGFDHMKLGGQNEAMGQLMQNFLPGLSQLFRGVNQNVAGAATAPNNNNNNTVQLEVGGVQIASVTASGVAQPQAAPSSVPSKIEAIIQLTQRALLEDQSLRAHLNALYLFKIYQGTQIVGTPTACYMLDAKSSVSQEQKFSADMKIAIDCSISIGENDLTALFEGRLNTWQAFLQGRVQVDGDMNAALRLIELADRLKEKTNV